MPLPPADSWARLRKKGWDFGNAFPEVITELEVTVAVLRAYIGHNYRHDPDTMPENWVRTWLFMLYARTKPEAIKMLLGDDYRTYFSGVMVPGLTMGGDNIRQLIPIAE